jgi:predicted  nucleic acid-binding Zn-ribbon protein
MLAGWPGLVAATQAALGISWPRLSPLVSNEIDQSLSDRLRHHRHSAKSVSDNPLLSAWLRESYAIFLRWAEEGEQEEDYAVLDRIRTDFNGAAPAFARLVAVGQYAERKLNTVESSLKDAESRCVKVTEQLEGVQSELKSTQAELDNLRSEANELQGQLSLTQSALAQRSAEADDSTSQLRALERRFAEELDAERCLLAERVEENAQLTRMLRDKEDELSSTLTMARAEIEDAERRIAEAENTRRAEADVAEERAREAESARRKDIERLDGELQRERSRISDRFKEIATMTRLLSEKESAEISAAEETAWLRNVSEVLLSGFGPKSIRGWLLTLLPEQFRAARRQRLLKRKGLFDAEAYLIANPDVAEAGLDPLTHYIRHGMGEGRQLG